MKLLELEDTSVVDMTTQGEEGKTQLQAMLGSLDTVNTPQEVGTTIDTADGCKMKVEDWLRKCQELFPDVNTVHTSVKVQETIREALEITTTETGATADPVHLGDSASSIMDKVQEITGEITQKQLTDGSLYAAMNKASVISTANSPGVRFSGHHEGSASHSLLSINHSG
ncbi:uncharacterized protein [Procambarus clarkii]|uniref:uncharacterized protein n=1 Tax=Procambarus clarkii TaxID=6728 RepID=UPI003742C465